VVKRIQELDFFQDQWLVVPLFIENIQVMKQQNRTRWNYYLFFFKKIQVKTIENILRICMAACGKRMPGDPFNAGNFH
jgi:hypothetical protein